MNKFSNIKKRELNTHTSIQTKKHPGGRPKKNEKDKRSEKVYISLTKEEKNKLEAFAKQEELPLGTWIRKVLKQAGYF